MDFINPNKLYSSEGLTKKQLEVREIAVNNFESFIRLVAPFQMLGQCHIDLTRWIQRNDDVNKLILWPRDHQKSRMAAFYVAWNIVRNPSITIIYASSTASKAVDQLRFIKNILTEPIMFKYFPSLISEQESKRALWNTEAIIVDHPSRRANGVVDTTIFTAGTDKNITGKHCALLVLDDVVTRENTIKEGATGRKKVNAWVAQAASIMSADSETLAVGTRYHPEDAYAMMLDMTYFEGEDTSENDDVEQESKPLFIINQANVEKDGEFLWPREKFPNGKYFGFNWTILNKKKAIYEASGERTQFYAQYYNDPNDRTVTPIARDMFRYYNKEELYYGFGGWGIGGSPLTLYCAVDLAASIDDKADFTAVVIGGIDIHGNKYLIDGKRYRTDKISETKELLETYYNKYRFKELRIEIVAGFKLVAEDLRCRLEEVSIRVPVDFYTPPKDGEGKQVRILNILEPMYKSQCVYHYRGGISTRLEDELVQLYPDHDDVKDAWAMCMDMMKPPKVKQKSKPNVVQYHPRFGGVVSA